MKPLQKMQTWIDEEKHLGSPNPGNIVLATAADGIPHSRVVAIREILSDGVLFFTQSEKRKAKELLVNPCASMTLWLPLQQKQIILEGKAITLSAADNDRYWHSLSRERQLLFSAYSCISDQEIKSSEDLQEKKAALEVQYKDQAVPRENRYMGFKFSPTDVYFYSLGMGTFSELVKYTLKEDTWKITVLSP